MSARFDAAADRLLDTTAPISMNNPYTVFFWFMLLADPGVASRVLWAANRNGASTFLDWLEVQNPGSGIKFAIRVAASSGSNVLGSASLAINTWYAAGLVRSGATSLQIYFMQLGGSTMIADANNTFNIGARSAALREEMGAVTTGNNNPLGTTGGRVAGFKSWQAALSAGELALEATTRLPQRTDNLWRWTPIWHNEAATDYSGNGRPWTATGITYEDDPPIGYGAPYDNVLQYDAPTTFLKAVGGSIGPAGALARRANKTPGGTVAPAGAVLRRAAKVFAGTLAPSGAPTKRANKLPAGSLTPAGTMTRRANKRPGGSLTPTGVATKRTTKFTAGSITPSGATVRQMQKKLAGALAPAGALARRVAKVLAGSLTPTGSTAISRIYFRAFGGSITPAGAVKRQAQKQLSGSLTPAGSLLIEAIISRLQHVIHLLGEWVGLVELSASDSSENLSGEFGADALRGEIEDD